MSVLVVTSKITAEHVAEADAAISRMFAAIEREHPAGIKYVSIRLTDGVTYVAVLEIADGVANPLPAIPEFQQFQSSLPAWVSEPPVAGPGTVVGNYGFLD